MESSIATNVIVITILVGYRFRCCCTWAIMKQPSAPSSVRARHEDGSFPVRARVRLFSPPSASTVEEFFFFQFAQFADLPIRSSHWAPLASGAGAGGAPGAGYCADHFLNISM